jgi:glycosyltransferase involved in cell wall biosynthesis
VATSFGMLSTYPPTQCGLATFAKALVTELAATGADVGVVRIVDEPEPHVPFVVHELLLSDPGAARSAAHALDAYDVAIVQHEYGIFGGRDGADVIEILEQVKVPTVVVLHTVLATPTLHQHYVLARVVNAASVVVTMTDTARRRLIHGWVVDPDKVRVIAHGAADNRSTDDVDLSGEIGGRTTILTWGLLGQGKGIEWALSAMADLTDLEPAPLYRVVGETHPRVVEREGEAYRDRLKQQVSDLGIESLVSFEGRYLDLPALLGIVRSADVILLPYDSRDQVTSGVLTEAVVAGKPVISTSFPHAVELLSSGAGILVPQKDPEAISAALRRVLTEPGLAAGMRAEARRLAPGLLWSAVAEQYMALALEALPKAKLSVA